MNIMFVNDKKPNPANCYTEKFGTHKCMLEVQENLMRIHHTDPPEEMITRVLRFGTADIDGDYLKTITDTAKEYVKGIFRRLRKHGYDPKLMKLYVVGGGGCLIRNFADYILPSEKAFAYKLKAEALAHQGFRADLTSDQLAPKLTVEMISENDSASQVKRYIRLTNLIPEILQYVDEGRISFTPAVELSYLNEQEQYDLLEQMELNDCTPSLSQACRFKKISQEEGLTPEVIAAVMSEEKANQREMFKVPMERIRKYVPKANAKQTEDFVLKACEHYHRYLLRQRDRER